MDTPKFGLYRFVLVVAAHAASVLSAAAQVDLQLHLKIIAEPKIETRDYYDRPAPESELVSKIEIRRGEPVSLRFRLENVGSETVYMTQFLSLRYPEDVGLNVTWPDGRTRDVPVGPRTVRCGRGGASVGLLAGESSTSDSFVFEYWYRTPATVEYKYVFDEPGTYQVTAHFRRRNPYPRTDQVTQTDEADESANTFVSAPVTVTVLPEQLPDWEALVAHGILRYIRSSYIEMSKVAPELARIVAATDAHWLKVWAGWPIYRPQPSREESTQPKPETSGR
ncbi:MAG: hypothetical protein ACF8R9_07420 [Phycisphaerales bacterium JB054]